MVSEHLRCGAAWGKHKPAAADGGDGYGLLFCSEDFPEEGEEALRLLAKSVQWRADSSETPLRPSFAMWPVGTRERGVLAARLLDSGRDSFGRARTMWIEAAWFDVSEPSDAVTIAAQYLAPSGWPAEPWCDAANIRLASDAPENDGASLPVSRFIQKHKRVPRFLVPGHSSYIAEGFDAIHDPDGLARSCDARRGGLYESGLSAPIQVAAASGRARPRRRGWLFLTVLIAAMAATIGVPSIAIRRERARTDAARAAAEEAEKTIEHQRREMAVLEGRLQSAENGIRSNDARLRQIASELDELRAEEKAFEDYWEVIKEHDIKSADHLRARLDRLDDNLRRKGTDVEISDGQ